MKAEIITIGDEILIGQVLDTNSHFIATKLDKSGIQVVQISSVRDDAQHILEALKNASNRANLVILTGGLGPTKDDITKEVFCAYFEDQLVQNEAVVQNIQHLLSQYEMRLPLKENIQQALVPSKATVLMNKNGTAPGMWMEQEGVVYVSLPGVPYEMRQLLIEEVLPRVEKRFKRPYIYHKTLITYGWGESAVAHYIAHWEDLLPNDIRLAYLPSSGKVRLRLSGVGENKEEIENRVNAAMDELHDLLLDIAVGYEEETSIVERIGQLLSSKKLFLSSAESCTGGKIAAEITKNPGISSYFKGGVVPYDTSLKTKLLGVPEGLIKKYNVVSLEVAESMASRCRLVLESDYAIATTGIAGPDKGEGNDKVGTVCIAIATPTKVISEKFNFGKHRNQVVERSVNKAFEMLWQEILKI